MFSNVTCDGIPDISELNDVRTTFTLGLLGMLLLGASPRAQTSTPFFMELPENALPYSVDGSGWVSVGLQYDRTDGMYWMPATGTVSLGGVTALEVSRDGRRIVGNAFDAQLRLNAAVWQGGSVWQPLGGLSPNAKPCDATLSSTYGANADATVVVGLAWDGCSFARAFRWTAQTGMVNLGSLTGTSTRANSVSGDGRVVVGWETDPTGPRLGAKWVDGVEQMIKAANGHPVGEAFGTNRDGSIIVGSNCDFLNQPAIVPTGFVWTAQNGVQCLPVPRPAWLPPSFYQVLVQATSDDGRVMVGSYSFGLDSESLIWLDGQVYFLRDYLRNNGVPTAFVNWVNSGFATAVTPNGRTIVGYGAGSKTFQGYMVVLPDRGKP
jgi:probable HAF family extracellular repeat protein